MVAGTDPRKLLAAIDLEFARSLYGDQVDDMTQPRSGFRIKKVSMADVMPTEIDWLWENHFAAGKLHIVGGHPGDGKSTVLLEFASIMSRGDKWPDGSQSPEVRSLLIAAEDAIDDTIAPRLAALGAHRSMIDAVEASTDLQGRDVLFSLQNHLHALEEEILESGHKFVIIDPLTSYMTGSDRNAEGAVRDLLTPLGEVAKRTGAAIVGVLHVGKPNGTARRPVQQLLGATAFGAIARIVMMVAPVPGDDPTLRALGVVKSNIGIKPPAQLWSRLHNGPIIWHGQADASMDELFSGEPGTPIDMAEVFLAEYLKGGSKPAHEIRLSAKENNIAERTLERAKERLNVAAYKLPGVQHGAWHWKLPDGSPIS